MFNQTAESVFVLPYTVKDHSDATTSGLAGLLGPKVRSLNNSVFGGIAGTRQAQLDQYFGAVAAAVRYRANLMGTVPTIVRAGSTVERQKSEHQQRLWSMRYKAFCSGSRQDPGLKPESRWLSTIRRKGLAGSHRTNEELEYLDAQHPLVKLVNDPNPPQVGMQFWALNNTYLDLCGVSYLWIVLDNSGKPVTMWLIPPSWVDDNPRDENTPDGELYGSFTLRSPYGGTVTVPPFRKGIKMPNGGIIRLAYDSPLSMLVPDSRVFAHRFDVDMLGMIQNARYCGLQNGGELGTIVQVDPNATISKENMERFVSQFSAAYGGVYNQNRLTFIPQGMTVNRPPDGRETQYSESEQRAWERVFEVFDLDYGAMIKAGSSSYAAPAIARKNFRFNVVKPRQDYVAAVLTEKLFSLYGEEYRAVFEDEGGYVDPQERRADWTLAVNNPLGPCVTINEIRTELLGIEPYDDPSADMLFAKPGMVPLDQLADASEDAAGQESGGGSIASMLAGLGGESETAAPGSTAEGDPADEASEDKEFRAELVDKILRDAFGRFAKTGSEQYHAAAKHVLDKIGAVSDTAKKLAVKAGASVGMLALKVEVAARNAHVSNEFAASFLDSVLQTTAVHHTDAIRHLTGLDYQTAFEVALHVATYARIKLREHYNGTKGGGDQKATG